MPYNINIIIDNNNNNNNDINFIIIEKIFSEWGGTYRPHEAQQWGSSERSVTDGNSR